MSQSWADLDIDVRGRSSGSVKTRCPKNCSSHAADRDLHVDLDKGAYYCHNPGCGFKGYLDTASNRLTHISRSPDYDRASFRKPDAAAFSSTVDQLPIEAIAYMNNRGISHETLRHFKVGWADRAMKDDETGEWEGAFLFPFYRGGELVNVKKRTISKKFMATGKAELIFFNLDAIAETTIIVEGELDVFALYEAGITNVISVPNGAPAGASTNIRLEYLNNCAEEIHDTVRHFILMTDGDAPGMRLRDELSHLIGLEHCSYVLWPKDAKDANDVLRLEGGKEMLHELVRKARPYPVDGIARPKSDLRAALDNWRANGLPVGLSTGWENLDDFWRPVPGEMTIVTGVPSHGKSSWCDALLMQLYDLHGWRSVVFSPENYPTESHAVKLLEIEIGKAFDEESAAKWAKRGFYNVPVMDDTEYEAGLDVLEDAVSYIIQQAEGDGLTLDQILDLARSEIYRRGAKVLVIDPWNEIEHEMQRAMSETLYISAALSKIRRFARHVGVHIFVVAHPTKLSPQLEKYKDDRGNDQVRQIYPIPDLYQISGSSAWKNKADNGISVWRDEFAEAHDSNPHLNTIVVTKVKRKWVGRKGAVQLLWDPPTGRYAVPTPEEVNGSPPAPSSMTEYPDDVGYQEGVMF